MKSLHRQALTVYWLGNYYTATNHNSVCVCVCVLLSPKLLNIYIFLILIINSVGIPWPSSG